MSSKDCTTLEGFVSDCLYGHHNILHVMLITRELEDKNKFVREYIEYKLNGDYDEETQNWRDYRNSLADVFDPCESAIDCILTETNLLKLSIDLITRSTEDRELFLKVFSGLRGVEDDIAEFLLDNFKSNNDITYKKFYPVFRSWWIKHFKERLESL